MCCDSRFIGLPGHSGTGKDVIGFNFLAGRGGAESAAAKVTAEEAGRLLGPFVPIYSSSIDGGGSARGLEDGPGSEFSRGFLSEEENERGSWTGPLGEEVGPAGFSRLSTSERANVAVSRFRRANGLAPAAGPAADNGAAATCSFSFPFPEAADSNRFCIAPKIGCRLVKVRVPFRAWSAGTIVSPSACLRLGGGWLAGGVRARVVEDKDDAKTLIAIPLLRNWGGGGGREGSELHGGGVRKSVSRSGSGFGFAVKVKMPCDCAAATFGIEEVRLGPGRT